jgi:hypothetical protein
MCSSTVFLKTELFSLVHTPSLSRNLVHADATQRYPCVLLLCARWFSTRGLRFWHLWDVTLLAPEGRVMCEHY